MIEHKELKRLLNYNPETGIFTRLEYKSSNAAIGDIAGAITSEGYLATQINHEKYYNHRLAYFYMMGVWPDEIDHQNHIRTDNRWDNLISVRGFENKKNNSLKCSNKSGFNGVYYDKSRKKWQARIGVKGKTVHLGRFYNKDDAIEARKTANKKYKFHENHGVKI